MSRIHARLRCCSIRYRQGFFEVTSNTHPGLVNLEAGDVSPDCDLASIEWVDDDALLDEDVQANTELELTPAEARALGNALLEAADDAEAEGR